MRAQFDPMRYGGLLALAVLLLGSCQNPVAPKDARPLSRPALYAELWARAERCTGRTGRLDRIRWYVVAPDHPNGAFTSNCPRRGGCWGRWLEPHSIYLSSALTTDQGVIVHEMIHDLLQDGSHRHPAFRGCPL